MRLGLPFENLLRESRRPRGRGYQRRCVLCDRTYEVSRTRSDPRCPRCARLIARGDVLTGELGCGD